MYDGVPLLLVSRFLGYNGNYMFSDVFGWFFIFSL